MKCPKCKGSGKVDVDDGMFIIHGYDCGYCLGTGYIEPLTNEDYIRSCSTEELPKALKEMFFDIKSRVRSELGGYNELMKSERYFDEWLKEKYNGKNDM